MSAQSISEREREREREREGGREERGFVPLKAGLALPIQPEESSIH
jgi:hypothetical protein